MFKRTKVMLFFLVVGGILAQVGFLNFFAFFGIRPDFILALVVFVSFFCEKKTAFLVAFFSGVTCDIFSAGAIGLLATVYLCVFLIVGYSKKIVDLRDKPAFFLVSFVTFIFAYVLYYVLASTHINLPEFYGVFKNLIIPAALYALAPFFVLYFTFGKMLELDVS